MTRMSKLATGGLALLVVGLLVSTQVLSQGKEKPTKKEAGGQPSEKEMAEMMAKWKQLNALGPQHKELAKSVGRWDTLTRIWMAPNAPPTESKGKSECRLIYGGRYLVSDFKGEMMGEPFEGMAIDGYDNAKKKYVSIWLDSGSTCIVMLTGEADASGKVITYTGKVDDPMTGQKDKPIRSVVRLQSDDKFMFEWYETGPDGKEAKTMEIEYARAK
jgi:hypothetical protein